MQTTGRRAVCLCVRWSGLSSGRSTTTHASVCAPMESTRMPWTAGSALSLVPTHISQIASPPAASPTAETSGPLGSRTLQRARTSASRFVPGRATATLSTRPASTYQGVFLPARTTTTRTGRLVSASNSAPTAPTPTYPPSTANTPALAPTTPTPSSESACPPAPPTSSSTNWTSTLICACSTAVEDYTP